MYLHVQYLFIAYKLDKNIQMYCICTKYMYMYIVQTFSINTTVHVLYMIVYIVNDILLAKLLLLLLLLHACILKRCNGLLCLFLQLCELYTLLNENYVEDDDNMFRFDYSPEFLLWALQPPGWKKSWHCGVRVATNKKLVGFISAVPANIKIRDQ